MEPSDGPDDLDLRRYVRTLARRRTLVAAIAVVFAALGLLRGYLAYGARTAEASLLVSSARAVSSIEILVDRIGLPSTTNEIAFLSSERVRIEVERARRQRMPEPVVTGTEENSLISFSVVGSSRADALANAQAFLEAYRRVRRVDVGRDLEAAANVAQGEIDNLDARLASLPDVAGNQGQRSVYIEQVSNFRDQLRRIKALAADVPIPAEVLSPPTITDRSLVAIVVNLLGFSVLGLLVAAFIAWGLEARRDPVRAGRDVERKFAGVSVVGAVPRSSADAVGAVGAMRAALERRLAHDGGTIVVAAVRAESGGDGAADLARLLVASFVAAGRSAAVVVVAAPAGGTGLAGGAGPVVAGSRSEGLDTAEAELAAASFIAVVDARVGIAPDMSRAVIARARETADVVVVAGPPVLEGAGALDLAVLADVLVVVARAGRTPASRLGAALVRLETVRPGWVGVAVMGVEPGDA